MSGPLILSIFPGVDLLGRAFEEEWPEACIVRGPDLIFGGDIRSFHPPAGKFDGVIGGPPCQAHSSLVHVVRAVWGEGSVAEDLTPEFARCVTEADPEWWLMENVPAAPTPDVPGFRSRSHVLNNRSFGGVQNRERLFVFGTRTGAPLDAAAIAESVRPIAGRWEPAVCSTAGGRRHSVAIGGSGKPKGNQSSNPDKVRRIRPIDEECELQGLPRDFLEHAPFTAEGKRKAVGNGVPLPMGRAVARAVKRALADTDTRRAS